MGLSKLRRMMIDDVRLKRSKACSLTPSRLVWFG